MHYNADGPHPFHLSDFIVPEGGFKTFNQFFLREFDPKKRSLAGPDDPTIIVSPNEGGTFFLDHDSVVPYKGTDYFDVQEVFPNYSKHFIGGPLLDSLLWYTDYHHFTAPVSGQVVEVQEYMGSYNYDFDDFDPDDPTAPRPPTDGSDRAGWYKDLASHRRFNWVIDTGDTNLGYVGMSAIGFLDIGSIANLNIQEGDVVAKGQPMGHFNYGGSSIILAFEPGRRIDFKHVDKDGTKKNFSGPDNPVLLHIQEQIGKLVQE
jgi:phosphatidylserine decarboxylase